MGTLTKGLIHRQDQANYDGTLAVSRTSSSGGTTSGLAIGNAVDVLTVFGSGADLTLATINTAINALGSANIAIEFAPGTWTIDDDLTIASNFTCIVPAGCVFSVSASKTLTIAGVLFRQHGTYTGGSGTVTVSGTDLLATSGVHQDYDVDTGTADAYVVTPASAPSSYADGAVYRFKAGNANTGASTINVNALGVKDIKGSDGSTALAAGEIVSGSIYTVVYEGTTNNHFHLMDSSRTFGVGDTAAGDNAAIGYTAAEGLILTGQGSTNDVTIKNDADADVITVPTGTQYVLLPGQPAFRATNAALTNVTGTAATGAYTIVFAAGDPVMDQAGSFDGTSTYTALVAGQHLLLASARPSGITAAADDMIFSLVTSNDTYAQQYTRTNGLGTQESMAIGHVCDMDLGDTATVTLLVTEEASDVVDISAGQAHFSGCLLA